jgi:hypothetical protein
MSLRQELMAAAGTAALDEQQDGFEPLLPGEAGASLEERRALRLAAARASQLRDNLSANYGQDAFIAWDLQAAQAGLSLEAFVAQGSATNSFQLIQPQGE